MLKDEVRKEIEAIRREEQEAEKLRQSILSNYLSVYLIAVLVFIAGYATAGFIFGGWI